MQRKCVPHREVVVARHTEFMHAVTRWFRQHWKKQPNYVCRADCSALRVSFPFLIQLQSKNRVEFLSFNKTNNFQQNQKKVINKDLFPQKIKNLMLKFDIQKIVWSRNEFRVAFSIWLRLKFLKRLIRHWQLYSSFIHRGIGYELHNSNRIVLHKLVGAFSRKRR